MQGSSNCPASSFSIPKAMPVESYARCTLRSQACSSHPLCNPIQTIPPLQKQRTTGLLSLYSPILRDILFLLADLCASLLRSCDPSVQRNALCRGLTLSKLSYAKAQASMLRIMMQNSLKSISLSPAMRAGKEDGVTAHT